MEYQRDGFTLETAIILTNFHPWQCSLFWRAIIGILIKPKYMTNVIYAFVVLGNLQQKYLTLLDCLFTRIIL